jgi:hypothetical protein
VLRLVSSLGAKFVAHLALFLYLSQKPLPKDKFEQFSPYVVTKVDPNMEQTRPKRNTITMGKHREKGVFNPRGKGKPLWTKAHFQIPYIAGSPIKD